MKYWITIFLLFFVMLLIGCQEDKEQRVKPSEMHVEDLPDVRAFEDEFTREFLQSTEETREGYYSFMSGTKAYKMDFPAGGIVGKKGYSKKEQEFESYLVGVDEGNGFEASIKIDYYSKKGTTSAELGMLSKQFKQKLNFKSYDKNDNTISLANFKEDKNNFGTVALLDDKNTKRGLSLIYETECVGSDEDCEIKKKAMQSKIEKWINSIKFVKYDKNIEAQ
ncbi:hypothetical protein [Virgibacillus sp. SK37]|uniref:hypothetical protein n=1 Tax=Virgibacillus sp. SK37 TaxID=403957 RepID=UPI0004D18596|nr:hypothetical protein [Virgibacillus sp. SK37]AIF42807.1 hypothetical protein X953_05780 [Virgibacillus sp. SK37]